MTPLRRAGTVALLVLAACGDDGPSAMAPDVEVRAAGCSLIDELSKGVVVAEGRVLTAAHGLRGATAVTVDGEPATVVALDQRIDAALLAAPTTGPPAAIATEVAPGPARIDGRPGVVERLVVASVEEPRDVATYRRRALVIDGDVRPGDSGSGVRQPDGELIGMVFAASTRTDSVAYAVAASELQPFLDQQPTTEPVDVGACR